MIVKCKLAAEPDRGLSGHSGGSSSLTICDASVLPRLRPAAYDFDTISSCSTPPQTS
jgi:hypothetical protein